MIEVDKIVIPENRQRREFKPSDISELADSITEPFGLMHAPILRNDGVTLVAGERRLRAIKQLYKAGKTFFYNGIEVPAGMIPFVTLAELSTIELMEAELAENILRTDLTWQEQCQAIAALDELRSMQNPQHTRKETAIEMLGDVNVKGATVTHLVSDSIVIAQHLSDPQVAKAKSKREAMKVITNKFEQEFKAELLDRHGVDENTTGHTLLVGDCRDLMAGLQPDTFDCILADPPYGINADTKFGDMSNLDHEYADDKETAFSIYHAIGKEGYRIAKPQAHMYIFCDLLHFAHLKEVYEGFGWWVWKKPIIWDKGNNGLLPYPDFGPRYCYETILYAIKGERRTTAVYRDIIQCSNVMNKVHAAQKPVDLYAQLLRRTCYPGNVVLDTTCGSGTIFPAATRESLIAVGMEMSEASARIALSRIGETDGAKKEITDEDL